MSGALKSLYQRLNSLMHNRSSPEQAASINGIVLQQMKHGAGLDDGQIKALMCICESFLIAYKVRGPTGKILHKYPGINAPKIAEQRRQESRKIEATPGPRKNRVQQPAQSLQPPRRPDVRPKKPRPTPRPH